MVFGDTTYSISVTSLYAFLVSISQNIINADLGRLVGNKYLLIMKEKMQQAISNFMDDLKVVNELHHPNDYRKLYDIALFAYLYNSQIPYDAMNEAFNKVLEDKSLDRELFEKFYSEYIKTIEIAFDVIKRMSDKIDIPSDFKFF